MSINNNFSTICQEEEIKRLENSKELKSNSQKLIEFETVKESKEMQKLIKYNQKLVLENKRLRIIIENLENKINALNNGSE